MKTAPKEASMSQTSKDPKITPIVLTREQLIELADDVTENILLRLGFDLDNPEQIRKDLAHLRRWREATEKAESIGLKVVITTIIGGLLGAIWLGFQAMIHKA